MQFILIANIIIVLYIMKVLFANVIICQSLTDGNKVYDPIDVNKAMFAVKFVI